MLDERLERVAVVTGGLDCEDGTAAAHTCAAADDDTNACDALGISPGGVLSPFWAVLNNVSGTDESGVPGESGASFGSTNMTASIFSRSP